MLDRLRAAGFFFLMVGCSLDASHPNHCKPDGSCPQGRSCYAGFCIVDRDVTALDGSSAPPIVEADAAVTAEPPHDASAAAPPTSEPPVSAPPMAEPPSSPPAPTCTLGTTCVGDQLALCADGQIVGGQACVAPGACMVARCEAGRGCIASPASDGTSCAGGSCLNGACQPSANPSTCADANCTLSCQQAAASCTLDCAASSNCSPTCAAGTACDVRCRSASNCELDCRGACTVQCEQASNCRADCRGGSCDITCPSTGNCDEVRCRTGATCLLRCQEADKCRFRECAGTETSCSPTLKACNRACP